MPDPRDRRRHLRHRSRDAPRLCRVLGRPRSRIRRRGRRGRRGGCRLDRTPRRWGDHRRLRALRWVPRRGARALRRAHGRRYPRPRRRVRRVPETAVREPARAARVARRRRRVRRDGRGVPRRRAGEIERHARRGGRAGRQDCWWRRSCGHMAESDDCGQVRAAIHGLDLGSKPPTSGGANGGSTSPSTRPAPAGSPRPPRWCVRAAPRPQVYVPTRLFVFAPVVDEITVIGSRPVRSRAINCSTPPAST